MVEEEGEEESWHQNLANLQEDIGEEYDDDDDDDNDDDTVNDTIKETSKKVVTKTISPEWSLALFNSSPNPRTRSHKKNLGLGGFESLQTSR